MIMKLSIKILERYRYSFIKCRICSYCKLWTNFPNAHLQFKKTFQKQIRPHSVDDDSPTNIDSADELS